MLPTKGRVTRRARELRERNPVAVQRMRGIRGEDRRQAVHAAREGAAETRGVAGGGGVEEGAVDRFERVGGRGQRERMAQLLGRRGALGRVGTVVEVGDGAVALELQVAVRPEEAAE